MSRGTTKWQPRKQWQPTTKWQPRNKKRQKREGASAGWRGRLEELERVRRPFTPASKKLCQQVFEQWLPEDAPVVEIGAGSGQLREWMGGSCNWLHTEPDASAIERFRALYPTAQCQRGAVERLALPENHYGAVVGLCVLDLVTDLGAAFREMRRVLRDAGRIVHLLDLSPTPHAQFTELAERGLIVLPNVFSDPTEGEWPEDLLGVRRAPMLRLLEALAAKKHPLPHTFGRYMRRFVETNFDAPAAAAEFDAIARTPATRELLKNLLLSAYHIGHQLALPPPVGERFSSARGLAERLQRAAREGGFVIERNALEWAHHELEAPDPDAPRYRRLVTGLEARSSVIPDEEMPDGVHVESTVGPPSRARVEVGMHLFVARKVDDNG